MKILITGGTGLIGTEITSQLLEQGHDVAYLSRHPGKNRFGVPEYRWDPDHEDIDPASLEGVEAIINLAGASLNKRWTPEYKSEILRSRVDGTRLLYNTIRKYNFPIKVILSASAVGYYANDYKRIHSEEDAPGADFLSMVCQKWEQEAQNFEQLNIRVVRCRIGIVLSDKGGALPRIAQPVKFGMGAPLGSGQQGLAWIHIKDVAGIFIFLLTRPQCKGPYNVVGPYNVTNKELTKEVSDVLHRPFFMPSVPAIVLKLALGEMASIALASNKASNKKIEDEGYKYTFSKLNNALQDLL